MAVSVAGLVAARVLQAIGAALLTPASLSLVLAAFPTNKRALAVSLWGAVGGLAAAVGPSLGAFVIASLGWQWAFYLNVPLGILAIWRGATLLTEAKQSTPGCPLDLVGMGLLIVGIGALALSIVQAESPAWSHHELLAAAGIGLACVVGFVAWARSTTAPLVDLGLFRNATYRYVNLATLSFGIAFSMMFFAFFFYMKSIWHYFVAAGWSGDGARTAAGDSSCRCVGPNREPAWSPTFAGCGRPDLRGQRTVVFAGARH
ncbi:MFS transporter [Vogesella indigofera]|uniref:MFS transporter n=1 Tax=Vogesella indigofera TaxID=45465 RepID=UPI0035AEF263